MGGSTWRAGQIRPHGRFGRQLRFPRRTPKFLALLREGHAFVQGCRLPWGVGNRQVEAPCPSSTAGGAIPTFSVMARFMFKAPMHDVYCGMRGFTKELCTRPSRPQRCTGMEFATEMIIKSSLYSENIAEVPITLHPDGRSALPHLKTFRDGWAHARFYCCTRPAALPDARRARHGSRRSRSHSPPSPSAALRSTSTRSSSPPSPCSWAIRRSGSQSAPKSSPSVKAPAPEDRASSVSSASPHWNAASPRRRTLLPRRHRPGPLIAIRWATTGWGHLDYPSTMRVVIPGVAMAALGFQTILSSFFISILGMRRR